ncbi:MAG: YspA, cpYpsA-related family [Verrucomicrobiota bacterium]|jgi:hypothetical protein
MSARAFGVIVTGGRHHLLSVDDFALIERTMRAVRAKEIHTDGSNGVAAQVEAWARRRGVPVWRVTANWMHDGPATTTERNSTLVELARTVIAFPGEAATEDLIAKARKRRLRIIESPGRQMAHRPIMDRQFTTLQSGPRQRPGISP